MTSNIPNLASSGTARITFLLSRGALTTALPILAVLVLGLHYWVAATLSIQVGMFLLFITSLFSFVFFPAFALCLLFATTLFQSFWVGVFMDSVHSYDDFKNIQAANAIVANVTFLCALAYILRMWKTFSNGIKNILIYGALFIGAIIVFSLYGIAHVSFSSVFSYLRNYSGGMVYLIIGLAFAKRLEGRLVLNMLIQFGTLLTLYGFVEFFDARELYTFVHLTDFMHYKYSLINENRHDLVFFGLQDTLDWLTSSFLNLSGNFGIPTSLLRPVGPIFHNISNGYSLAFFLLVAVIMGRPFTACCMFCLLAIIGVKGATALVLFSIMTMLVYRLTKNAAFARHVLYGALTLYVAVVLVYGYLSNDNHFVGMMGGFKGFLSNPVGHGIGVGGNSSETTANVTLEGGDAAKFSGDYALESGFAVLLYQAGIFGIVTLLLFWNALVNKMNQFVRNHPADSHRETAIIMPAALIILMINSLFQEEVFTPTCWGLWTLLAGFALNNNLTMQQMKPSAEKSD